MQSERHCRICDHRKLDTMTGSFCGLTNAKPNFSKQCNAIQLNKTLEERIEDVEVKLKLVTRTKTDTIGHFIFYFLISLSIIFVALYLGNYAYDWGVISTIPLIIIGVGFSTLVIAVAPVNKYRTEIAIAKKNKANLLEILNLYKLAYTAEIKITDVHGTHEVEKNIKVFRTG